MLFGHLKFSFDDEVEFIVLHPFLEHYLALVEVVDLDSVEEPGFERSGIFFEESDSVQFFNLFVNLLLLKGFESRVVLLLAQKSKFYRSYSLDGR